MIVVSCINFHKKVIGLIRAINFNNFRNGIRIYLTIRESEFSSFDSATHKQLTFNT